MDGFAHGGNMGAAELSQQDLGVSRAVAEGNEGAAPVRGLSLIKNTIRARATASRILEERAWSSWQRVGRMGSVFACPLLRGDSECSVLFLPTVT